MRLLSFLALAVGTSQALVISHSLTLGEHGFNSVNPQSCLTDCLDKYKYCQMGCRGQHARYCFRACQTAFNICRKSCNNDGGDGDDDGDDDVLVVEATITHHKASQAAPLKNSITSDCLDKCLATMNRCNAGCPYRKNPAICYGACQARFDGCRKACNGDGGDGDNDGDDDDETFMDL